MDWIWILGGLWLGHYLVKKFPTVPSTCPVRTVRSVRKAFKNNLHAIKRLPLNPEEREAANEAARQKMLRDLDELMS